MLLTKLQDVLSIYVVIVFLIVGLYMSFSQSKSLSTANHLEKEAKFTKFIGWAYIALGIVCTVILIL